MTVKNKIAYTQSFEPNSSAIKKVYYAEPEQMLFVEPLRGGGLAGYYDVTFDDFLQFMNAESAGRHWRTVKDNFYGFNTADIELVESVQQPVQDVTGAVETPISVPREQSYAATILPVNPPAPTFAQRRFVVEVEVTSTKTKTVYADDLEAALDIVKSSEGDASVRVKSATQFFD